MKLWSKETAGLGLIGAWLYGANELSPGIIGDTVSYTWGAVSGILETVWEWIESVSEPVIWAAAPMAAPLVAPTLAWAYIWNRVWNYLFNEDQIWRKRAATVTGGILWAWAAFWSSAATPFIVGGAALYAWRKVPLWAAKKIAQAWWGLVWWATGLVWWGVKWAWKWAWNTARQFASGSIWKPQVGF